MTPSDRLRAMVEAATPGPWLARERQHHWNDYDYVVEAGGRSVTSAPDAALIALVPEIALLLADMGETLHNGYEVLYPLMDRFERERADSLLARFDALTKEER